jgi:hypothetical protein
MDDPRKQAAPLRSDALEMPMIRSVKPALSR